MAAVISCKNCNTIHPPINKYCVYCGVRLRHSNQLVATVVGVAKAVTKAARPVTAVAKPSFNFGLFIRANWPILFIVVVIFGVGFLFFALPSDAGPAITNEIFDSTGNTSQIAFSPNDKFMATLTEKGRIIVWNIEAAPRQLTLIDTPKQGATISAVAISNQYLAIGDTAGNIDLYATNNYQRISSFNYTVNVPVNCLAFSPNGLYLVSGISGVYSNINIFGLANLSNVYRATLHGQASDIQAIAFNPANPSDFATGSKGGGIFDWNIADSNGTVSMPFPGNIVGGVNSLAFSPDGKTLAVGATQNKTILINTDKHNQIKTLAESGGEVSVTFTPNNAYLISANSTGIVTVWNAKSDFKPMNTLQVRGIKKIANLTFSSSGATLGVAGDLS